MCMHYLFKIIIVIIIIIEKQGKRKVPLFWRAGLALCTWKFLSCGHTWSWLGCLSLRPACRTMRAILKADRPEPPYLQEGCLLITLRVGPSLRKCQPGWAVLARLPARPLVPSETQETSCLELEPVGEDTGPGLVPKVDPEGRRRGHLSCGDDP